RIFSPCFTVGCSIEYCVDAENKLNHAATVKVCLLYLVAFSLSATNMDIYENAVVKIPCMLLISALSIFVAIYFSHNYVTDSVVIACLSFASFCLIGLPTCYVVWKFAHAVY
ncbi:hypothetical protein PFISCL1PPCAC_27726, partial [Pristionchus fissidentatus]